MLTDRNGTSILGISQYCSSWQHNDYIYTLLHTTLSPPSPLHSTPSMFNYCNYPHAFLKKPWGYCNRLRPSVRPSVCPSVCPSVRPSRYLLLNHWTKFNQIWCVGCSHEWGVQRHIFFWPRPLGPWGGAKRSNIIKCH